MLVKGAPVVWCKITQGVSNQWVKKCLPEIDAQHLIMKRYDTHEKRTYSWLTDTQMVRQTEIREDEQIGKHTYIQRTWRLITVSLFTQSSAEVQMKFDGTIAYETSKRSPPSCYLLHTLHNEIHLKFCCSTLSIPSNHSLYTGNAGVLHRNWARNLSVLPKKLLDIYCLGFRQDFSYYSLEFHCVLNWILQWSFEISGILFMKSHWNDMEINSHRINSVVSLFGAPCHFGWNQTCPIYHQRCKSQWREEFMFIGSLKLCTHHCFC